MPDKEEAIVLYCKTGERSALAAHALMQLGYRNVKSLKGGYRKWLDPNAPEEEAVKSSGGCG
jgi:rhodanese-related sulfurtransferase